MEPTRVDVDDWPIKLNVGDCVMYRHKKWIIIKKMSDKWHCDKATFILERNAGVFNRKTEQIRV